MDSFSATSLFMWVIILCCDDDVFVNGLLFSCMFLSLGNVFSVLMDDYVFSALSSRSNVLSVENARDGWIFVSVFCDVCSFLS